MAKRISLLALILLSFSIYSQKNEFGIFLGGSNLIGDVGSTTYVNPNQFAFGLLYKWNKSSRHAYRFSYNQSSITANDFHSDEPSRQGRSYFIRNNVQEFGAGLEFNFFDFPVDRPGFYLTPYVHSGLAYTRYSNLYIASGQTQSDGRSGTLAIPLTLGLKAKISRRLILAAEIGFRSSLARDIDGSNPKNPDYRIYSFGSLNSRDRYVMSGFTLTYIFGNKACFCN